MTNKKKRKNKLLTKMILHTALGLMMMEIAGAVTYMIDGIVTSWYLGDTALAANGITGPIFSILTILSGVMAAGFQNIAGRQMGEGHTEEAKNTWRITWQSAFLASGIIMILGILFSGAIASLLGATAENQALHLDASYYIKGFMIGTIPYVFTALFVPVIQINGFNNRILLSIGAMIAADTAGDLLNVFIFHGGMFGMGIATSFSYFVSAAVLLSGVLDKKAVMRIEFKRNGTTRAGTLARIIILGLPKATKRVCNSIRPMMINRMIIAAAGQGAMVAMSVQGNVKYVLEAAGVGISGAALLLVGVFMGEMNQEAIRSMRRKSLAVIWIGISGLGLLYFLLAGVLADVYLDTNSPSFGMAVMVLRCHAVSLPFLAYNEYQMSYLQAANKISMTHLFNILQRFVVITGLSFALNYVWGINGIWCAIPLTEIVISILLTIYTKFFAPVSRLLNEEFYGDFSESLTSPEQIPEFLNNVDDFLREQKIENKTSYYAHLFFEELTGIILKKGFEDKKTHELNARIIHSKRGLMIRTQDDCLALKELESSDLSTGNPEDPLLGMHMVFRLAKKVEYVNSMNMNHMIITL